MRAYRYWRQCWRCCRDNPDAPSWRQLWSWLPHWQASFSEGRDSLTDERPWITFGALEFLDSLPLAGSRVFEWGSGGSSLYFARRAANVVSVEHDSDWFQRVRSAVQERQCKNWQGFFLPPTPNPAALPATAEDCNGYVSDGDEYRGCDFRSYVTRIDHFADESFDLVLIDGRARPSCLKHALPKVKPGGCLIWDNSERSYYHPAMRQVPESFDRLDFSGPGPYVRDFWRTTVWIRRRSQAVCAA